jgi:curved DNA-binding protein CbpA
MKTVEKELKKFNFPEILVHLHRSRKTGTLTVGIPTGVTKKVYLDKGNAVFASSTDEDDRLGEMLIKLGKITFEQYDKSVELLKQTGKRQGAILVELGFLTPKDLVLGVKSQVREIIYSLFQVEDAEYEFEEGELSTREVITLQMSMGNLIYEGMKRINNVIRIKREMPDMGAVLKLNEDAEGVLQDIVLSQRDKAMLEIIDGTKSVREIIEGTPSATFEAMKILYILYTTGFVAEQKKPEESVSQGSISDESIQPLHQNEGTYEEQVNALFSNLFRINAHEILGIDETADAKEVQRNYYKLVKDYHPDHHISSTDPLMLDKLITISDEIQKAYVLLKDDNRRSDYFRELVRMPQDTIGEKESEEEEFRSELSKVNEEILSSRDASDEMEIETEKNRDILNVSESPEPAVIGDYPDEEQLETTAAKVEEEIFSACESSDAEIELLRYDSSAQEQTTETIPIKAELGETKPDDVSQELQTASTDEIEQKEDVSEKRRNKRFKVDGADVGGEMFFAREANIFDISLTGIALKVDKQMKVGKEYVINLRGDDRMLTLRAKVVRSLLSESRTTNDGESVPIYMVGMEFTNVTDEKEEELIQFIDNHKIRDHENEREADDTSEKRRDKRFQVDMPEKTILGFHERYKVKVISLSGMLIESLQRLEIDETIQMQIFLPPNRTVPFLGRVVSCKRIDDDHERYDIGLEFMGMSEEHQEGLQRFFQGIEVFQGTEAPPKRDDPMSTEMTRGIWSNANESGILTASQQHERDHLTESESLSRDTINLQLVNLMDEIKMLLTQLRDELPGTMKHQVPATEETGKQEETKESPSVISNDTAVLQENNSDYDLDELRKEYKAIPQKASHKKRKLKLWHIAIPLLFLVAATVSFLFVYTPEKPKKVIQPIQPIQSKKETLPAVSPAQKKEASLPATPKTPVTPTVSTPEVKKASAVAPSQAAQHTIELIASESTWLSAAIDDKASKEMILKAGDKVKWTAKSSVSLIIGNAAGLKIIFDGKEISPLGGKGKVVRLKLPSSKTS